MSLGLFSCIGTRGSFAHAHLVAEILGLHTQLRKISGFANRKLLLAKGILKLLQVLLQEFDDASCGNVAKKNTHLQSHASERIDRWSKGPLT